MLATRAWYYLYGVPIIAIFLGIWTLGADRLLKQNRFSEDPVDVIDSIASGAQKIYLTKTIIDLKVPEVLLCTSSIRQNEFPKMRLETFATHVVGSTASSQEVVARLLRAAAAIGLLDFPVACDADNSLSCVRGNAVTNLLIDSASQEACHHRSRASLAAFVRSRAEANLGAWSALTEAILAAVGGDDRLTAFEIFHNVRAGVYFSRDDQNRRDMSDSLAQRSLLCAPRTAEIVRRAMSLLESLRITKRDRITVVDVGSGSSAHTLRIFREELVSAHPDVRVHGVAFDVPQVVETSVRASSKNISFVGGNFFESVPSGDIYVVKNVLHAAGDDHVAESILRVLRSASLERGGSAVVVMDPILREATEGNREMSPLSDLNLFVVGGGRDRTDVQWRRLFRRSGFRVVGTSLDDPAVDATKPLLCGLSGYVLVADASPGKHKKLTSI